MSDPNNNAPGDPANYRPRPAPPASLPTTRLPSPSVTPLGEAPGIPATPLPPISARVLAWLRQRAQEPSTWAGVAALLVVAGMDPAAISALFVVLGLDAETAAHVAQVGAVLAGLVAVTRREKARP